MKAVKRALAASMLLVAAACTKTETDDGALVGVGDPVPEFTVQMTDGTTVDIEELHGKVVVITLWATGCPYCQAEMKVVREKLLDRFAGLDLVFLPIARQAGMDEVLQFQQDNGYTFAMGVDPDRSIYDRFAQSTVPRNYVVDRRGIIVAEEAGYTVERFDALIDRIAAEVEK